MIDTRLAGRYLLETEIASGGMATVWRALDQVLGRPVAVKLLHAHLADDAVIRERFRLEALAAASLSHANIVAIYDTGEHDGVPFIVMEFLPGGTLSQLLAENGTLDPHEAASIGADVASALAYAHRAGIVHRDIKPANIMFSEMRHLKVVDFGIAKAAFRRTDLTMTGAILGTLRYVAPEQVQGGEPDGRTDLYALGVVLYQCVTGQLPFAGETELANAMARLDHDPPRPRDLRPDVPRALDAAIMRALARDPKDRFHDASGMEAALRSLVEPDTTPAHQVSTPTVHGVPAGNTSFVRSEGRWLLPTVLLLVLAAGIVLAALQLSGRVDLLRRPPAAEAPQGAPVSIRGSGSFDPPPGDGSEKDDVVPLAFDGDPETSWRTQCYTRADLGGAKPGVGIWFDLGEPVSLSRIRVSSPTPGWSATVRYSDDGRSWSDPGNTEEVRGTHDFKVSGTHRRWMVWITNLTATPCPSSADTPYAAVISEIQAYR